MGYLGFLMTYMGKVVSQLDFSKEGELYKISAKEISKQIKNKELSGFYLNKLINLQTKHVDEILESYTDCRYMISNVCEYRSDLITSDQITKILKNHPHPSILRYLKDLPVFNRSHILLAAQIPDTCMPVILNTHKLLDSSLLDEVLEINPNLFTYFTNNKNLSDKAIKSYFRKFPKLTDLIKNPKQEHKWDESFLKRCQLVLM